MVSSHRSRRSRKRLDRVSGHNRSPAEQPESCACGTEALAFSPDDRRMVMGFGNGVVIVCDVVLPKTTQRPRPDATDPQ